VNSSNLKDVSTAHFYPFVNGSSVPIKMRVEEGAFCPDPEAPCTTVVLNTEEEQEIYSADEHLWILFTEDAAEKLGEARRLDIQRIGRQCLPTSFQEYEACYSVTLTPSLEEVPLRTDEEEFEIDEVVLAICFDPRATHDHIWVHSADDMDPGTLGPPWPNRDHITPLAISGHSRPPGFCDGFTLLSRPDRPPDVLQQELQPIRLGAHTLAEGGRDGGRRSGIDGGAQRDGGNRPAVAGRA
jgi:hypothetical protein